MLETQNVRLRQIRQERFLAQLKRHIPFYLMLALPLLQVIVFNYFPIYGIQIAFKNFKMKRGIAGSPWNGFQHFEKMFSDPNFYRVLSNTLRLSFLNLLFIFPLTVMFALMMNEVRHNRFKRITQTVTYLPHFLSWVVVGGFVYQLLSPSHGIVNALLLQIGVLKKPVYFMIQSHMFDPIYLIATAWKELGWSIVIYLAAIAGIDPTLYESAMIDGAGRFQKILHITFPCILPTVTTMLILRLGSIVSVGFDPIFNLYNEGTYEVADVISTYVYRRGMLGAKYDYTTAVGLFQNAVGFALVMTGNWLAKKADPDYRIM